MANWEELTEEELVEVLESKYAEHEQFVQSLDVYSDLYRDLYELGKISNNPSKRTKKITEENVREYLRRNMHGLTLLGGIRSLLELYKPYCSEPETLQQDLDEILESIEISEKGLAKKIQELVFNNIEFARMLNELKKLRKETSNKTSSEEQ